MKSSNFEIILKELNYKINTWETWDKITRINLTTNGSLYMELGNETAQYKFDKTNELLLKRIISNNKVIKVAGIIDVNEIISVELLNKYSESVFNGNSLLRQNI